MANRRKSTVLFNTREEVISSDINRLQQLIWKEVLNERKERNRSDSLTNVISGDNQLVALGVTKPYLVTEPTWDPDGASFDVDIGAGEAHQPASAGAGADEPEVLFHRWAADTLTFDAPDPNPRIDIVISTPLETPTDAQTRTILQDPSTGVTAPATVNKTVNQTSTLSIVKGTAAASNPTPPVVPSGSIGLFAVLVKTGAADAADLAAVRMINRSTIELLNTYHGAVEGFAYSLSSSGGALVGAFGASRDMTRVVIDGELLVGAPPASGGNPDGLYADTLADPFAVAAGDFDVPYYVYLVGGSSFVNEVIVTESFNGAPFDASPLIIVESLTPPDANGHPSAAISTPWGTTQRSALFIGWGWKEQNSTTRKAVEMSPDGWVHSRDNSTGGYALHKTGYGIFDEIEAGAGSSRATIPGASSFTDYPISSAPPFPDVSGSMQQARRARISAAVQISDGTPGEQLDWGTTDAIKAASHWHYSVAPGTIISDFVQFEVPLSTSEPPSVRLNRGVAGGGVALVEVFATSFFCPMRRLSI